MMTNEELEKQAIDLQKRLRNFLEHENAGVCIKVLAEELVELLQLSIFAHNTMTPVTVRQFVDSIRDDALSLPNARGRRS